MKRSFRFVSLLLVAVMVMAVPVFAKESAVPYASRYIMSTCIYLDQTSSTQFNVWHEVIALGIMDEVGACEIKIQQSADGQNWTTVRTFTPAEEPSMIEEDALAHAGHVSYTGMVGYYYRAFIILYAKNSSGRGEVFDYTETLRL